MGISWRHTLNDIEIDEPIGFDAVSFGVIRDKDWHGIGFEATTSVLSFTGNAYDIIVNSNEAIGLKSNIIYVASSMCDGELEFTEVLRGRLNFGKLRKTCGIKCTVSLPVETDSCEVILNSRFDQQVDVDKFTGVDNTTAIEHYTELGDIITLPSVEILSIDEAHNTTDNSEVISAQPDWLVTNPIEGSGNGHIAPKLDNVVYSSVGNFNVSSFTQLYSNGDEIKPSSSFPMTIDTDTLLGSITCDFRDSNISLRVKGRHQVTTTGLTVLLTLTVKVYKLPEGSLPSSSDWVTLYSFDLPGVTTSITNPSPVVEFDNETSFTTSITQGDKFAFSIYYTTTLLPFITNYTLSLDKETFFKVEAPTLCKDSDTQYYMIHETLSHVVEQITNGCLRVKSSLYGRVDSEPYAFDVNGCGGLRMLTSGLKIRKAVNATFFCSIKQLLEGLNAIDNIGFDVDGPDVRVENVGFFYLDKEILRCPSVSLANINVDEEHHYAKIISGYKTWKVEKLNGLDEFNSEREFKTSLETISNELNIQSELVAGSYSIEVTRQQSFAATGAADTSFDNEIFIICLIRSVYPYSSFQVETGNVSSPSNIFSPTTIYNWRIRPIANMMRWYKTIASSYRNFMDSVNKIFFSSGTGNILATGQMADDFCRPETIITSENQDVFFPQLIDSTPIWINEIVTFDYPMSLKDYKGIKAEPYGYISFQCGNGSWDKGFIESIQYKPVKGEATIILKRKY